MPRKIRTSIGIDKLKLCFKQPIGFYNWLLDGEQPLIDFYDFKLIRIGKENIPEGITETHATYNIILHDETALGQITFHQGDKLNNYAFCNLENKALYEGRLSEIWNVAETLCIDFNNVSCIEVFIDTNINIITPVIKLTRSMEYATILNRKVIRDRKEKTGINIMPFCQDITRDKTLIFQTKKGNKNKKGNMHDSEFVGIKLYNKSKEMLEETPYKTERVHSFDEIPLSQTIYRAEISLNNKSMKRYLNNQNELFKWDSQPLTEKLEDPVFLQSLWEWATRKVIYWRIKKNRKDITLYDVVCNRTPLTRGCGVTLKTA